MRPRVEYSLGTVFDAIKQGKHIFVAITGGIGSGKSRVADIIRSAGYTVLSADSIAQELIAERADIRRDIAAVLGEDALLPDGRLDKDRVRQKVFGPTDKHAEALRRLNAAVHPYVVEELAERLATLYEQGAYCVFNETALVFEAGLEECYDYIVVVDAPEELRIERVLASRSIDEEDVRNRINMQMAAERKKQMADFVIDNSGTPEALEKATKTLLVILPTLAPRKDE